MGWPVGVANVPKVVLKKLAPMSNVIERVIEFTPQPQLVMASNSFFKRRFILSPLHGYN